MSNLCPKESVSTHLSISTALILLSGVGCAYLIVVSMDACPRSSFTTGRLTLASTSRVAKVCLKS